MAYEFDQNNSKELHVVLVGELNALVLMGYCTPNQKLVACFVLCLKIINTFLKNNICILKQIVQATHK